MRRNIAMTLVTAFPAHFPCAQNSGSESKPATNEDKTSQTGTANKLAMAEAAKRLPPLARTLAVSLRS